MWLNGKCVMAVQTCSEAILAPSSGHGKSPCFSGAACLQVFGPDVASLVSLCVDGVDFLECAF